jgi:hypothetical protein
MDPTITAQPSPELSVILPMQDSTRKVLIHGFAIQRDVFFSVGCFDDAYVRAITFERR